MNDKAKEYDFSSETFDSESDVTIVPANPSHETPVSDEGIVFMDSAEGEIMDSQEIERIDAEDERTAIAGADSGEIKLDDLIDPIDPS